MPPKPKLGELLISAGILDELQVKSALARQQRWGGKFGENVIALEFCDAETLNRVVAKQLGVRPVSIRRTRIDLTLLQKFPKNIALKQMVLPLSTDGKSFTVAMADPNDGEAARDTEFRLGKRLNIMVADAKALAVRIEQAYQSMEAGESELEPESEEIDVSDGDPNLLEPAPEEAAPAPAMDSSSRAASSGHLRVVVPPRAVETPPDLVSEEPEAEIVSEGSVPPPKIAARTPTGTQATDTAGNLVLIVDSDEDVRRQLRLVLRRHGCRVVETGDGLHVVDLIKSQRPQLLMIDLSTQDVAGIDMCRKLKSSQAFSGVPIVLMSGQFSDWRSRDDLMELTSASAFVPKPLDLHQARITVQRLLETGSRDTVSQSEIEAQHIASELVKSALQFYEAGDYAKAIPLFIEAADYHDSDGNTHYYLAEAYTAAGQKYKSLGAYEKAVDRMQDSFLVLKKLAVAYEKLGFKRKAYEAFERSARVCPNPQLKQKILAYMAKML